jgi:hypothetical protein
MRGSSVGEVGWNGPGQGIAECMGCKDDSANTRTVQYSTVQCSWSMHTFYTVRINTLRTSKIQISKGQWPSNKINYFM